jgi:mRNA interferase RelE/StbE
VHKLLYTEEAKKQIKKLHEPWKGRIREATEKIAVDPEIGKPLTRELKGRWSFRVGDYHILYRVHHAEVIVLILTVGHRREIYKRQKRKDF